MIGLNQFLLGFLLYIVSVLMFGLQSGSVISRSVPNIQLQYPYWGACRWHIPAFRSFWWLVYDGYEMLHLPKKNRKEKVYEMIQTLKMAFCVSASFLEYPDLNCLSLFNFPLAVIKAQFSKWAIKKQMFSTFQFGSAERRECLHHIFKPSFSCRSSIFYSKPTYERTLCYCSTK